MTAIDTALASALAADTVLDLETTHNVDPRNLPATFLAFHKLNDTGRSAGMWMRFIVGTCPGVRNDAAIEKAKAEQARYAAQRAESEERCDTDGFVSQRCHQLNANVESYKIELAERGGYDMFPGLFNRTTGERMPAVLEEGTYGWHWRLCDPATGQRPHGKGAYINDTRGPRGAVAKAGCVVLGEWATAEARVVGSGKGFSGLATARGSTVRTDGGYPDRP